MKIIARIGCLLLAGLLALLSACQFRPSAPAAISTAPATDPAVTDPLGGVEKEALDTGVYRLSLPASLLSCSDLLKEGDWLLTAGISEDGVRALYACNLSTGTLAAHGGSEFGSGQLCRIGGGAIGFISDTDGSLYRLETPDAEPTRLALDNRDLTCRFLSDGSLYRAEDSVLQTFDRDGKPRLTVDFTGTYDYIYVRYLSGNDLYLTAGTYGATARLLRVDTASGAWVDTGDFPLSGCNCADSPQYVYGKPDEKAEIRVLAKSTLASLPTITTVSRRETPLAASDSLIATRYTGNDSAFSGAVALYGRDGTLYYFGVPFASAELSPEAACLDGSRLFVCCRNSVGTGIRWFCVDADARTPLTERPLVTEPGETPAYVPGVTLLSGKDAILSTDFYTACPQGDSEASAASAIAEETLRQLPDGFVDELLGSRSFCHSLVISLTGTITPLLASSVSNPGGYTESRDGIFFVTVDATHPDSIRSTLFHELMHVVDHYLAVAAEGDAYPAWQQYLPGDDVYFDSYRDETGNDINDFTYTANGYTDPDEVWFATPYCRTFATEDRAVMFELLCTDNPYYRSRFPHIEARMRYLAQIIRSYFSSVQNADSVLWEKPLQ